MNYEYKFDMFEIDDADDLALEMLDRDREGWEIMSCSRTGYGGCDVSLLLRRQRDPADRCICGGWSDTPIGVQG